MKRKIVSILLLLALLLSACSSASNLTGNLAINSLSDSNKLMLGILKLEGTDQAITAEQAAKLLPRWQLYQQLVKSGTAAQAEYQAVLTDIKASLTSAQLVAIDQMGLTQQEVASVVTGQNVSQTTATQARSNSNSSSKSANASSGAPAGGPGGGIPIDLGGGPMMIAASSSQSTTSQSSTSINTKGTDTSTTALLSAVIQLLESKTA